MTKAIIYLCELAPDRRGIVCRKVWGFAHDGIGLRDTGISKSTTSWSATHMDTGLLLTGGHATRAAALKEAKKRMAMPGTADKLAEYMTGPRHQAYMEARYKQSVTTVF